MARRQGIWAELQRERARQQRLQQQAQRAAQQAALGRMRQHEQAMRAAARQAATSERERKQLYTAERKAEAAAMTSEVQARVAGLNSLLAAGTSRPPGLSFASLKQALRLPGFDPGSLGVPIAEPRWEQFAPQPPKALGRMLGGSARFEREQAAARDAFERELARQRAAEADRQKQLADLRVSYDQQSADIAKAVLAHNAEMDQFELDFCAGEPEAVAQFFTLVLDASAYPEGFPHRTRALYRPEPKEVVVEYELPPQSVIPAERDFKYVQARDEIATVERPAKEVKDQYAQLIAQVALRTIHEVFVADLAEGAAVVTFNGHVSTKDRATGQTVRPCLISVSVDREVFGSFVLTELDPVACLHRLNALVSLHPFDLEAVRPVVDFETLLSRYKFVEGMDAVAGLDSRRDLLDMTPTEFEHLVRQLFESMGMKSWNTQASKDDGVDAVAINEDPVFGGLCIIQAKRYRGAVGVEAVRALAGVMEDKHATKGIMVTTSWVAKDGHAFASRHGRMQVMECEELKFLCKEHLGLDILISLPKPPPGR
jgi:restriction system protein